MAIEKKCELCSAVIVKGICQGCHLEQVFSAAHTFHGRIFYDFKEGKYYDKHGDRFLEIDELAAFGLG